MAVEKVLANEYKVSDSEVDKQVNEAKDQLGDQFLTTLQQNDFQDEDDYWKHAQSPIDLHN